MFFSATQDIAIDAYRTDVAAPSERGVAAALTNLGYRPAAWLAAAVALIIADHFGYRLAFFVLAAMMLLFCIGTLRAPSTQNSYQPRSLRESIVQPLKALLGTPSALTLIAIVLVFKAGDAFANKLFTPFMLDTGLQQDRHRRVREAAVHRQRRRRLDTGRPVHGAPGTAALDADLRRAGCREQPALLRPGGSGQELPDHDCGSAHRARGRGHGRDRAGGTHHGAVRCALQRLPVRVAVIACAAPALQPRISGRLDRRPPGWYAYYVVSFLIALPGLAMVWWNRRLITSSTSAAGHRPVSGEDKAFIDLERVICRISGRGGESVARAFTIGRGDWPLRGLLVQCRKRVPRLREPLPACRPSAGPGAGTIPHRRWHADPVLLARRAVREVERALRGRPLPGPHAHARAPGGAQRACDAGRDVDLEALAAGSP